MMELRQTYRQKSEAASHTLLFRGFSYSPPGGRRIYPTGAHRCGTMQKLAKTLDTTSFSKTLGTRIILKLKKMGKRFKSRQLK